MHERKNEHGIFLGENFVTKATTDCGDKYSPDTEQANTWPDF